MNLFWSIVLGLVQGFTEFIPVSSSGHLVLIQNLIPGFTQPGVLFDVVLHLATLLAVFYFFRKTLVTISKKYVVLLAVGTVPAAIFGFLLQSQLEKMFGGVRTVGVELIITGILNILVDEAKTTKKLITLPNSFLIGIAQAIAIIPGISRSGATIFTAVRLGIDRQKAAEFSFLLSIPAILGANVLQLTTHGLNDIGNLNFYIAGFFTALASGYLSIRVVYKFLLGGRFKVFGYYCIVLGFLVIFLFNFL